MKDNPRMFNVQLQFGNILGLSVVIISSENKVKTLFKNFLRSSYLPPNSRMIFNILCKNMHLKCNDKKFAWISTSTLNFADKKVAKKSLA